MLSPIEQSIKRKIETVGIPLKNWNIQINYGIKTGFNDAFIISTERRNEILANCITEEERIKTEDLIRPILRGRDIKKYGYNWADLWLINTHNGIKDRLPRINIEDYPSIKTHLDCYWDNIKSRADQGDTPYNLRNCAYLEEFFKPKIVYREIGVEMDACLIPEGWFINNKLYLITGDNLDFVLAFLNSRLFNRVILSSANLTGGKGVDFMENIRVPQDQELIKAVVSTDNEKYIDELLYSFYELTQEEINYLNT